MDNLKIRLYENGDEYGIITLFKEIFGRDMTLDEWRWKYKGKGNEKVYSSVALNSYGKIVAHYGGIPHRMIYKGKEIRGLSIGDLMVHTSARGTKTFKRIAEIVPAEAVRDGIILGYGFPNERAFRLSEKIGIYEKIEDVMDMSKEVKFVNNAARYAYKLFPLSFDDIRIDALWHSLKNDFALTVIRGREYLRWRYDNHPFLKYELWGLCHRWNNKLIGLAVLRHEGEKTLLIDFLTKKKYLRILLTKIENYCFTIDKKNLSLWAPPYLIERFKKAGFSITVSCTCIPRTTHEKTLTKTQMQNNFFYTMGDTDFL